MGQFNAIFLKEFFRLAADRLDAQRLYLCELDGEIGDGDHGTSMANGFNAVVDAQREMVDDAPGQLLCTSAAVFLNEVGATVGPLYASAILQAAKFFDRSDDLQPTELGGFLDAMVVGITQRGGASPGDKTMIDAWLPAAQLANSMLEQGSAPADAARGAADAADRGARATAAMIASRGRAARLNERSLGHLDPGAVSAAIIITALADTVAHHMTSAVE